ncbi:MAG: phytanoyl-CoA dioxygenase family protein [bacterium]|nr:phytanoyl-CoA dioxygenase family protein [bacterium]MCY3631241.1 phytanoyl-CoA dioxygenase family protein [bacterium]
MAMTSNVPPAALDSYHAQGFFILDGFALPNVGEKMFEDVVGVVREADKTGITPEGMLIAPEAQDGLTGINPEDTISKVFTLHDRPVFSSFLRDERIAGIMNQLIGPDVDCFLSQFIFKNPGAWGQPWHQDSFYFPFDPPRPIVGLWLAVTEATLENGCLHILPGSHAEPVHEHVPDRRPAANYGYMEIVGRDMSDRQAVMMQAGDLLVFDSHLMHCSTDNISDGIRAAMVYHCCAADTVDLGFEQFDGFKNPMHRFDPLLRSSQLVG